MRLPVIVESNAWTLPQERYNAEWIREHGVGVVLPNFRGIGRAVEEMLEPSAFARFHTATQRLHNRAVFEIPDILETIMDRNDARLLPETTSEASGGSLPGTSRATQRTRSPH
jgi:1,2-diacylglycerol 3-beta-galactosyltransferase